MNVLKTILDWVILVWTLLSVIFALGALGEGYIPHFIWLSIGLIPAVKYLVDLAKD